MVSPVLEAVRDHLVAAIAGLEADKATHQAQLDAINAELAKPEVAVADQIKALVAKL